MNMKTLGSLGKHPGGGPLLGPESYLCQCPFISARELAEQSAMALRMDGAGENFHPRNPGPRNFQVGPVCAGQLAGVDANLRDPLGKRAHAIIAYREGSLCFRRKALPALGFLFVHGSRFTCLTRSQRVPVRGLDCSKDRAP